MFQTRRLHAFAGAGAARCWLVFCLCRNNDQTCLLVCCVALCGVRVSVRLQDVQLVGVDGEL